MDNGNIKKNDDDGQRLLDESFMRQALELAKQAAELDEVPVGAIIVKDGEVTQRLNPGLLSLHW